MAKIKNEPVETEKEESVETVENKAEETVQQTVETETEKPVEESAKAKTSKSKKSQKEETVQEIPDAVKKLLALYPNYPALWVNVKGGVFPEKTQPSLVKDAILYKNPYFKH